MIKVKANPIIARKTSRRKTWKDISPNKIHKTQVYEKILDIINPLRTTMRYHSYLLGLELLKEQILRRMWRKGKLLHLVEENVNFYISGRKKWKVLKKLKIELVHDTASQLLHTCTKEMKLVCGRDSWTPMFTGTLSTIGRYGNTQGFIGGWMNKEMLNIYLSLYLSIYIKTTNCTT